MGSPVLMCRYSRDAGVLPVPGLRGDTTHPRERVPAFTQRRVVCNGSSRSCTKQTKQCARVEAPCGCGDPTGMAPWPPRRLTSNLRRYKLTVLRPSSTFSRVQGTTGTVVGEQVVVNRVRLAEGAVAAVLSREPHEPNVHSREDEDKFFAAITEVERGNLLSHELVLEKIRKYGGA